MMGLQLANQRHSSPFESQYPGRSQQIEQLTCLFDPKFPSPPATVIYGLEATGKTTVTRRVLKDLGCVYAFVSARECITVRHLLEKTVKLTEDALNEHEDHSDEDRDETRRTKSIRRCDNTSMLLVQLQNLLCDRGKFILVFDDIDRQREAPPTLIPGLARLGEMIPNISVVFIVQNPTPRLFHLTGLPHIHFDAYRRAEVIEILSLSPLPMPTRTTVQNERPESETPSDAESAAPSISTDDAATLWTNFVTAVWDTLGKDMAPNLHAHRDLCQRLWQPFVEPVLDGTLGPHEFSRLMVKNRALFQNDDKLIDRIIPLDDTYSDVVLKKRRALHKLPFYMTFLLISAYLASHNPAKTDELYFARYALSGRRRKRRRRNPLSVSTSPMKKSSVTATSLSQSKRTAPGKKLAIRAMGPQPFALPRLFAIFRAIVPPPAPSMSADLYVELKTLERLRLVVRVGSGDRGGDALDGSGRWTCTVAWEVIRGMAQTVDCQIEEYICQ